jgi:hypothetical protein
MSKIFIDLPSEDDFWFPEMGAFLFGGKREIIGAGHWRGKDRHRRGRAR